MLGSRSSVVPSEAAGSVISQHEQARCGSLADQHGPLQT